MGEWGEHEYVVKKKMSALSDPAIVQGVFGAYLLIYWAREYGDLCLLVKNEAQTREKVCPLFWRRNRGVSSNLWYVDQF